MEVTPLIYSDETGQTHLSYDHATVKSSAAVEQANIAHRKNEAGYFKRHDDGTTEHIADGFRINESGEIQTDEGEILKPEQIQHQREVEPEAEYDVFDIAEAIENQMGREEYNFMTSWASQSEHISKDFIDEFNAAIDAADMQTFARLYNEIVDIYTYINN